VTALERNLNNKVR